MFEFLFCGYSWYAKKLVFMCLCDVSQSLSWQHLHTLPVQPFDRVMALMLTLIYVHERDLQPHFYLILCSVIPLLFAFITPKASVPVLLVVARDQRSNQAHSPKTYFYAAEFWVAHFPYWHTTSCSEKTMLSLSHIYVGCCYFTICRSLNRSYFHVTNNRNFSMVMSFNCTALSIKLSNTTQICLPAVKLHSPPSASFVFTELMASVV